MPLPEPLARLCRVAIGRGGKAQPQFAGPGAGGLAWVPGAGGIRPSRAGGFPTAAGEKVWEWRPSAVLAGQRFQNESEVDEALGQAGEQIKTQIRQGYTVVVK